MPLITFSIYLQITALSSRARSVHVQHTPGRVAARVITFLFQPAIAFFAGLDKSIPAHRPFEQTEAKEGKKSAQPPSIVLLDVSANNKTYLVGLFRKQ